ncbi:putative F-box protein At1g52490 [Mangifera indica]|uniref:putative F-box protein At1g52490 n=1 Tax=Mangifera indica TaxID=29780 RepID=UPI001CFC2A5C|nr:putative F-box protein At1g52490 [Mangifera indica]
MTFIPAPLLFEFLIRLPVKSLAKFKCINKTWFSLLSDPDFIYSHLNRAKTENHLALLLSFISHDNLSSTINFFAINDHELADFEYSVQGGIHICNPATKNTVKLPGNRAKGSRLLSCGFGYEGVDETLENTLKLTELGFKFKYSLEDMYAGAVDTCRAKGLLPLSSENPVNE